MARDSFEITTVLVVAPLRVARYTWAEESKKWDHLKDLTLSVICGTAEERRAAVYKKADVYVINRENLVWLIENFPKARYDMVVYDELSSFKNHQAKRFKAALTLSTRAHRVVGLTGTPAPNGLMDLFAEYRVVDLGERLGRFIGRYRESYFKPGRCNGHIVYEYIPLPGAEEQIYDKVSDITLSMTAADHLDMPELIETAYPVNLSPAELENYKRLKNDYVLGEDITAANAAGLSNKLLQMANGAIYTDEGAVKSIHDKKLDGLEDIIEAANGKPLLVAYWFKHDLARIEKRLNSLKIPYKKLDSDNSINDWNAGKITVALIHPASAGHGLNLQKGGCALVWFGLTWSLELYQQTNARLYRQGQKHTVVITHLITKGTIDERVLKALQNKETTQAALIDAVKAEVS